MAELRELICTRHGKTCDGNAKHAHIFRWVTVK